MFNWDFAGLATRYLTRDNPEPDKPEPGKPEPDKQEPGKPEPGKQEPAKPESAPGTDDFSSMPVLLKKLRDPHAPVMNSVPVENPCVDILAQLDDDLLGHTLQKILGQVDWQALDQLIEHSGFLAGDRSWLRQTIHDRIAWLTTRLPESLEGDERVSMAEYKAIEAAGIRGGWLPVKGKDIRGGQICISQLLDANDEPITRMSLRLSRSAGNQLADNLALERGLHHLADRVRYTNDALNGNYLDWRSDLTSLAKECKDMAEQLAHDKERWLQEDHGSIKETIGILWDIVTNCQTSLNADQPCIKRLPMIKCLLPAPAFPARVSSRTGEEAEAMIQPAKFSHGFARLTGDSVRHFDQRELDAVKKTTPPVRRVELKPTDCEGGSILFYPPNLPDAMTFEHKLTITLPGHSKAVVEELFRELAELGIHGERPNTDDLEEQWLDSLADYHGCLGDMDRAVAADDNSSVNSSKKKYLKEQLKLNDDAQLDWEVHCRIRAGRLVHYRPGLPHGIMENPAREFYPGHNISFKADQQRETQQVVIDSLTNEAALTSYGRRTGVGMKPFVNAGGMFRRINYDTNYVFSRLLPVKEENNSKKEYAGAMAMVFKSEALGRLDGNVFADLSQYEEPYPELDAHIRNQKIVAKSTGDYQGVVQGFEEQETRFSHPLSLHDELKTLQVGSAEDQHQLLHTLKQRYSHWPDGRPLEQLFQQSWSTFFYELTCESSKVDENIKQLIRLCGEDSIQLLFEQNPQLLEGRLVSLDGLKLQGRKYALEGFDLSGCSMNGTVIKSIKIASCKINAERLSCATVNDIFVSECSFEGERFSSSILDNVRFDTETDFKDYRIFDSTNQLSRIIYQSCVNQQNELNLTRWLEVMLKNYFLRSSSTPLDDLSVNTLSQHIERIIGDYPHQLCDIIQETIGIQFTSVDHALNFVRNNPEFYDCKVQDFRDLHFDFRAFLLTEDSYYEWKDILKNNLYRLRSSARNGFSREAILELFVNTVNHALLPQLENKHIEFQGNINNADDQNDRWNNIYEEDSGSAKINTMPCTEQLDIIVRTSGFGTDLKDYQEYFHELWEACSDESKLTIAKYCLSHHVVVVSKSTKEKFMKFMTQNQEQKH